MAQTSDCEETDPEMPELVPVGRASPEVSSSGRAQLRRQRQPSVASKDKPRRNEMKLIRHLRNPRVSVAVEKSMRELEAAAKLEREAAGTNLTEEIRRLLLQVPSLGDALKAVPPGQRPKTVLDVVGPGVESAACVLSDLWNKATATAAVHAVRKGVEQGATGGQATDDTIELQGCMEVGVLMALRERCVGIEDEDLLCGCWSLHGNEAMEGFIDFLESEYPDGSPSSST
mmetsp:Transcript_115067/g.365591  ORF Transcript_115067/g.365591 Transcript_115067/m.365591 type:complete len:230 (+) Transcript_115067:55-744(+)|eukprot:CAMPEP_0203926610 /NCGR_PEP_ID=MMETSP0359-20131031/66124_1 /ASSEMBLY_ACC=CAM_ASM_000338 /TAXON_ID=268821 /ORGANISM="Scrippsiella Hangoei, Strain SHTV-5" /LENGTH=229 /DNA_ID=CAMNT_0050855247 /DNA_START=41 /DNA_END=730 /DNA_ORIENTATION=+